MKMVDVVKASKLWKEGYSFGQIAIKLGTTRNVIAGLSYRQRELFPRMGNTYNRKPVRRSDGEIFPSLQAAAELTGAWQSGISRAIKSGGVCSGYRWEFL